MELDFSFLINSGFTEIDMHCKMIKYGVIDRFTCEACCDNRQLCFKRLKCRGIYK